MEQRKVIEVDEDGTTHIRWVDVQSADVPMPDRPLRKDAASKARIDRDYRLRSTDWTQLPDTGMSGDEVARYAAYRQKLRGVTKQSGFPFAIEWPELAK
jgi:hypothetical protein